MVCKGILIIFVAVIYWHKLPTKTMWTVLTGPPDFFTLYYIQMIFSSSLAKATTPPSAHILLCCYVLFSSASPHFSAPLCALGSHLLCFLANLGNLSCHSTDMGSSWHGCFLGCEAGTPPPNALYPAPVASVGREASELKRSLKNQNQTTPNSPASWRKEKKKE